MLCKYRISAETPPELKSREIPFAKNLYISYPFILKFAEHGETVKLPCSAKFENDSATDTDVRANEISRDLSLRWVSEGYPALHSTPGTQTWKAITLAWLCSCKSPNYMTIYLFTEFMCRVNQTIRIIADNQWYLQNPNHILPTICKLEMAVILHTTFLNAFCKMKIGTFWWQLFHCGSFLRIQTTVGYRWFGQFLGAASRRQTNTCTNDDQ